MYLLWVIVIFGIGDNRGWEFLTKVFACWSTEIFDKTFAAAYSQYRFTCHYWKEY